MSLVVKEGLPATQTPLPVQEQCCLWRCISALCQTIYDVALKVIQAIGRCFSSQSPQDSTKDQRVALSSRTHLETGISTVKDSKNLIPFYRDQEKNIAGVTLKDILNWDDTRLESQHDYIQWLFPLAVQSAYNGNAPILDQSMIKIFRGDKSLQNRVLDSLHRMLAFYGLEQNAETQEITRASNFTERFKGGWLTPGNHNFLRITRIITSLGLLGLSNHATAFFTIMKDIAQKEGVEIVSSTSLLCWTNANNANMK